MNKDAAWGYDNEIGPHTWSRQFPQAAGAYQSPINVDPADAVFSTELAKAPLSFGYPAMKGCELSNTGYSFMVAAGDQLATVEGGPLAAPYRFQQFHMHWGAADGYGSEHALAGRQFAAELHLVHWDCSQHASFQAAAEAKDGLAVLAVFVTVGDANAEMDKLLPKFDSIRRPDARVSLGSGAVSLGGLLPADTERYFSYEGSLTTPPCYESVRWIVFDTPVTFSEQQLETLRQLDGRCCAGGGDGGDGGGGRLVNNYRHLIPVGRRRLLASWQP